MECSQASIIELKATEVDLTSELAMAGRAEAELRESLSAAEREIVATRERGEAQLAACETQRDSEARAHLQRAKQWETKLKAFFGAGGSRGMDLRMFVTNEPVYTALLAGLHEEESLAQSFAQRSRDVVDEQAMAEVGPSNTPSPSPSLPALARASAL